MHRDSTGLVDDNEALVLEQDLALKIPDPGGRWRRGRRVDPRRRDSHLVAFLKLVFRPHPATVHPHLAAPQDAVQPPGGQARQLAAQEVVDPLPCQLVIDENLLHPGLPGAVGGAGAFVHGLQINHLAQYCVTLFGPGAVLYYLPVTTFGLVSTSHVP